jgi:hypothetical protein
MKISTRSEYAAKALLFLVMQGDAYDSTHPAQIQAIAQTCDIPVKYLEQILVVLRNQGLLGSRRGVAVLSCSRSRGHLCRRSCSSHGWSNIDRRQSAKL